MKLALLALTTVALASAAPKVHQATNLGFHNLYKNAISAVRPKPHPKIIGGQEATPNSFPYMAFLEIYNTTHIWYCCGSIISENYILTAGHCGVDAIQAYAVLGAHRPFESEPTQAQVISTNIIVHSGFNPVNIDNDIAVLELSKPIPLSDYIQPVPLPSQADAGNDYAGATATAVGWGYTHGSDNMVSEVLNYVDLVIITQEACEAVFGPLGDTILCTSGDHSTGTCSGDSGGPLTVDGVQIGIVSFGVQDCPFGFPDAFTKVTKFLDWLTENTDVEIL